MVYIGLSLVVVVNLYWSCLLGMVFVSDASVGMLCLLCVMWA